MEELNAALQKVNLNLNLSHSNVKVTQNKIQASHESAFDDLWLKIANEANELDLSKPEIPRTRKAPRRLDTQSDPHQFSTPADYYRKKFSEIIDLTINSFNDRFTNPETLTFLNNVESFVIGNSNRHIDDILKFYVSDNFDKERLILHRDIVRDAIKTRLGIEPANFNDVG